MWRTDRPDLGVEGDRYPGIEGKVVYGEGVLVGYRYYETTRLAPLFPFGFGLSYGDMALEDVRTGGVAGAGGGIEVQATVVNNGTRRGTEVVQVYVRAPSPSFGGPTASSWVSPS